MSRRIGFDRIVRLDWLDMTVGLCQQTLDPDTIAEGLKQKLEGEIAGTEARRKTVTVLLRIWVNVPESHERLRDQALELAGQVQANERLWLHWGMSLLAYPVFRDVAATVGQLGRLQGTFSLAQVQRRMVESWGERTTLRRAIQRLIRTCFEWGVIQEAGERGNYVVVPACRTDDPELALWLFGCALCVHESEQVPLQELGRLSYAFPFDMVPFSNHVRQSVRFEVTRQGLDLEMVALVP